MSTNTECASPTRCRPQHLDRERLRGVLSAREYADVRYHEAVVVASSTKPKSFQLLALAVDCLYLFPLASSQFGSNPPTRIRFKNVLVVDVASPALSGQRSMMLEPNSQLFHILVCEKARAEANSKVSKEKESKSPKKAVTAKNEEKSRGWTQSEIFVSTFEPDSRVFFYVSQAFQAHFQKAILLPPAALNDFDKQPSAGEVTELLDSLIDELVAQPKHEQKSLLLNELAVAGTCNWRLQQAFFGNRTQLRATSSSDSRAPLATGLPAMVIQELFALLVESKQKKEVELELGSLEYVASALNLLFRMCFAGQLMPERLHFFLEASLEEFVSILTSPASKPKRPYHESQTTAIMLAVEEILDNQVALLLELEALQQEANVADPTYFGHATAKHLPQLVHWSPTFAVWVGKLFKRIARSVSRSETEMQVIQEQQQQRDTCWSLALWRNVKLLDLIWNAPTANARVLALVLETHVDYLNLYLRNPRYLEALRASAIVHISETAERLQRFLDALPDSKVQ